MPVRRKRPTAARQGGRRCLAWWAGSSLLRLRRAQRTSPGCWGGRRGCWGGRERVVGGGLGAADPGPSLRGGRDAGRHGRTAPRRGAGRRPYHPVPPDARRGLRSFDLLRPGGGVRRDVLRGEPRLRPVPRAVGVMRWLVWTLLGLGVLVEALSVAGLLAMPNLHDRLHFLTPATSVGGPLFAGSVVAKAALS